MLIFYAFPCIEHVVFELMFLTYDQLPPSIIVGTRGELNSQLWNVTGKPRKTNLKTDVFTCQYRKSTLRPTDTLQKLFRDI